jgi:molecular chaperone DnaJ
MRMHYDLEGIDGLGTSAASDDIMKQQQQRRTSTSTSTSTRSTSATDPFGSGFGDFSSHSQRAQSSSTTGGASADFNKSGDHTHVEFGDMSDPFYRGRGKGPRHASGGGSSIPSDQNKSFQRSNNFANEVHAHRDNKSSSTSTSTSSAQTTRSKSEHQSVKSKPFSDERFYGKNPDKTDSFFGGNRPGAHPGRTTVGDDIRVDWEIDLRKALFGGEEVVRVPCKETCAKCEGQGAEPGSDVTTCQGCGGNGSTTQVLRTPRGNIDSQQKCTACKGTGQLIENPCASCSAQGIKKAIKQVNITIPAFMEDGSMIILCGEGNPGPNDGPPGDLYVFLWAKDDPTFYREGDKIYSEESIDFVDAVLGCTVETPYIKFDVPPRTQHDHVVRLKGKGAPKKTKPKERGDHIVTVKVDMPTDLSKEEEDLFLKLKQLRDQKCMQHTNV